MAFCKYCGRQLADGEVCNCRQTSQETPAAAEQPAASAAPQQAPASAAPQQAANLFKGLWADVLHVLKTPVTYASRYIEGGSFIGAIILLAVQALCSGFYSLSIAAGAGTFFLTLLYSLVFSALMAVTCLVTAIILHGKMNFKQALCAAALRSIYLIPLTLLSLVMNYIFADLGMLMYFVVGMLVEFAMFLLVCRSLPGDNLNKKFFVALGMFLAFMLVVYILLRLFILKSYFTTLFGSMGGLGSLGSLMRLFG